MMLEESVKYFIYGEAEIKYLKSKCATLAKAIDKIGHINRAITPDLFSALVYSIVGQQISNKAASTICARVDTLVSPLTPANIAAVPLADLQKCGMSFRKVSYIKDIANTILNGELNLEELHDLPDDEVCKKLSALKGIGVWTAEMLMIFSMQRPNVLSLGDLAIHRGLRMLYGHETITKEIFAEYKELYSPYASIASLYLWAIAGGADYK